MDTMLSGLDLPVAYLDEKQKHNPTQGARPKSFTKIQDYGFKL